MNERVRKLSIALAIELSIFYLATVALIHSPVYPALTLRPWVAEKGWDEYKKLCKVVTPEDCYFNSDGEKLHGWLYEVPNSKAIVILHHGNAGCLLNRLFLPEQFGKLGVSTFLYDYQGYGHSTGTASRQALLDDGVSAYDFVRTKCKEKIVINYGESIGTAVACYVDQKRKSDGLVLQSGILSLPVAAQDVSPFFRIVPEIMWPTPHLNNQELLVSSHTPLLVMHGEKDTLVPCSKADILFGASLAKEKWLVKLPNCGHNDMGANDNALFVKSLSDFFHTVSSKTQATPVVGERL